MINGAFELPVREIGEIRRKRKKEKARVREEHVVLLVEIQSIKVMI